MTLQKLLGQFEEIADGLFLHGKETPTWSHSLPKGQFTVYEASDFVRNALTTAYNMGRAEGKMDEHARIIKKSGELMKKWLPLSSKKGGKHD